MNEDNMIFKTNEFSIEISPVGKAIQAKDIQYFSYDENSGLQLIHILMDGKPLDLPNGTEIRLSAVKLNNQNQKLIYTPEIVDSLNGIVSFVIPREFLGYQGRIRCGLYINFSNDQTMHVGYFYINMAVSDIDKNLTEFTEYFWQGWSEFEAGSTAKMQELEQRIDEQTEIFNNSDVYNKAEIEDKLEPFALQTDIDTLETKKADKTSLAKTDAEVAVARGGFNALDERLTTKEQEVKAQLAQTATKQELANILDGSPKGVYPTIADLQAAFPTGEQGVFLVTADGHIYSWDGAFWADRGVYQATGLNQTEVYDVLGLTSSAPDLMLTNFVPNGDFSNGATGFSPTGGTLTVANNVADFTVTSLSATARINILTGAVVSGRKYYAFGWIKPKYKTVTQFYLGSMQPDMSDNFVLDQWNFFSVVGTTGAGTANPYLSHKTDTQYALGDVIQYKYIGMIDLTQMYGAGNEPSVADMDALISGKYPETRWFNGTEGFPQTGEFNNGRVLGVLDDEVQMLTFQEILGSGKIAYVTKSGSDSNTGETAESGFSSLQKALDSKAETIYIERGIYYNQTADKKVEKVKLLPLDDISYSTDKPDVQKIEFKGSDTFNNASWVAHNTIFKQPYAGNSYFSSVFIEKTLPVVKDAARGIYNVNLWQGNDKENDIRLKPVLTLADCEAERGTFFYDGTNVFVNPTDGVIGTNEFNATKLGIGLRLYGGEVELQDVKFDFYHQDCINVDDTKFVFAQNSEAGHSSTSDGFSIDNANGRFVNCKAYKNAIDGFNLHDYGDTEFINCYGIKNYDDGISHHNGCTGFISGGVWRGNGKGGISPASGAKVNWQNAVMESNLYGAYHSNIAGVESISSGNLYLNNHRGIANNNAKVTSFNDKFVGNEIDTTGSGETVIY